MFKKTLAILVLVLFITPLVAEGFHVGGALRYNFILNSWDDDNANKGGEFAFDTFRLNVDGEAGGISLSAEYRFYTDAFGGSFLHHGYMGYAFNENTEIQLGVHQVPFGIQPYASNNFFFAMPYYVGLEDDYDTGIKLLHTWDDFDLALAFYKNMEVPGAGNSRYSVDVVGDNEEVNRFNLRAAYNWNDIEFGGSAQFGQVYNYETEEMGNHSAFAGHMNANFGQLNLKAEYVMYDYDPEDGIEDTPFVEMGSYGWPYQVASKADILVAGLSYSLPVNIGPISNLTFYNDYSMMMKDHEDYEDSAMNVVGCMVTAGNVYTYIDFAMGQNHPWLGGDWGTSLSTGVEDADWEHRFNINFGYYF